jgi:hypothetical protein
MEWFFRQLITAGCLDDLPEVHDCDALRDVPDCCKVVGNEEIGQPELLLEIIQEIQDLSLH